MGVWLVVLPVWTLVFEIFCHERLDFQSLCSPTICRGIGNHDSADTLSPPACSVFSLLLYCSFRTGVEHRQAHRPEPHPLDCPLASALHLNFNYRPRHLGFLCKLSRALSSRWWRFRCLYTSTPWVSSLGDVNGWFSSTNLALMLCSHLDEWFWSSCLSPGGKCRGHQRKQTRGSPPQHTYNGLSSLTAVTNTMAISQIRLYPNQGYISFSLAEAIIILWRGILRRK